MLFPMVEGRSHWRNLRSVPSDQNNEIMNYEKSAKIVRPLFTTIGFYRILVAMAVVFELLPRSTCLVMKDGFLSRSCFYCSTHHYHPSSVVHSNSRSRLLFEIPEKRRDFSWTISASVRGLFEVIDEESDGIDNPNDDYDNNDGNNDDDIEEEKEENEHLVSDAEALLACWSFLKRRKRLGDWKEYEERKSQNLLSRNYFLADDEEGYSILEDDDDDDDDDDEEGKRETHTKLLNSNDNDLDFDDINDDDNADSITTVEDILLASSIHINDKLGLGNDGGDEDGVAQDLKAISSFVSKTGGRVTIGVERSGEKEDIDLWHTEFTSFPTEPNPSRTRRVDAMKRRWEDPEYRKRWHEKRWGRKSSHQAKKDTPQTDRERQAVQRARALPSGFLGSDELASMMEDEIAEAIRTRIRSTRKRVTSRNETLQRRRDLLAMQVESLETMLEGNSDIDFEEQEPRQVFFSPTEETLQEAQRNRSERAKKLYATRVENQKRHNESQSMESSSSASASASKTKTSARKKGRYFPPKQLTPQDAFLRIEHDLDLGTKPKIDDVRLVLKPGKMKNRKLLLCRILEDQFDLTGKCVPPIPNEGNGSEDGLDADNGCDILDLAFVKRCTIERLGNFVLYLLKTEDSLEFK